MIKILCSKLKIEGKFSHPAYKKFGSHHSVLTSRRLNKLKNQQLFLDKSEKWGHGESCCPQNCSDRWITENLQLTGAETHEQKPAGTSAGIGNFWKLSVDESEREQLQGDLVTGQTPAPPLLWLLPPGALPGSHSEYRRKILSRFWQREGKQAIMKYNRAFCSS